MSVTFEEIVRAWILHYDERLPSDRKARREAFITLLANLSDHGFNKNDLNVGKKERIIKLCVNPNHKNKSKLRKWISVLANDLEASILIYYPNIKIRDNVLTEEMANKLNDIEQKIEEYKALKKEDSSDDDEEDEEPIDFYSLDTAIREEVKNPKKISKEFEITDEMLSDMDGPEVVWDKDFAKKLGLDNE